ANRRGLIGFPSSRPTGASTPSGSNPTKSSGRSRGSRSHLHRPQGKAPQCPPDNPVHIYLSHRSRSQCLGSQEVLLDLGYRQGAGLGAVVGDYNHHLLRCRLIVNGDDLLHDVSRLTVCEVTDILANAGHQVAMPEVGSRLETLPGGIPGIDPPDHRQRVDVHVDDSRALLHIRVTRSGLPGEDELRLLLVEGVGVQLRWIEVGLLTLALPLGR